MLTAGICFLYFSSALADIKADTSDTPLKAQRLELEDVVVTATRTSRASKTVPKNITVISAEDIANSTTVNIVDLLGREANLNIRSTTGNEGKSGIDIRGMGDTYVSNVIVMVDGFRLNSSDMAGPDFLSVPLEEIEKIEIVRGGSAVLYGDGAVGGVINIITRRPEHPFSGKMSLKADCFHSSGARFQAGTRNKNLSLRAAGGYSDSDGYRDNGQLRKKDTSVNLEYGICTALTAGIDVSFMKNRIGLPGPVSFEDAKSRDLRKKTGAPHDFSATEDNRITGKADLETGLGNVLFKFGYRDRVNQYIIGYTPLLSEKDQMDFIDENTIQTSLQHEKKMEMGSFDWNFVYGVDFFDTRYLREDQDAARKNGDTRRLEGFFYNEISLHRKVTLTAGYRYSKFSGKFRDDTYTAVYSPAVLPPPVFIPPQYLYSMWVTGDVLEKKWTNPAWEAGVSWEVLKSLTLFAGASKSYRIPNVDEFALSDSDLHPQSSKHYDAGLRLGVDRTAEISVSVFRMDTQDEIYYGEDPGTGTRVNRNYDETTCRRGIESELKFYPASWLFFWANYSYTRARFEKSNATLPLVPEHMGNIGLEIYPCDQITLAFAGTLSGPKFDGNDLTNTDDAHVLGSTQVFDVKITWHNGSFKTFFGINNLFDQLYTTSSYSGSAYPMPTRSFFLGMEYTF